MGIEEIRRAKMEAGIPKPKKYYQIPKISAKRKKKMAEDERPLEERLDEWFLDRRKEMTGVCSCGCAGPSCKNDDEYYRHSIAHIFPKAYFKSVATHPLNWVELDFWRGHHTNFDNLGFDKWVNMANWDDIKAKVIAMDPYLTPEEKSRKFYQNLIHLVKTIQ